MAGIGKILRWFFGLNALFCAALSVRFLLTGAQALARPEIVASYGRLGGAIGWFSVALTFAAMLLVVAVFGAAWWTLGKAKKSARVWALVASLLLTPAFLLQHRANAWSIAGVLGLIVFSRRKTVEQVGARRVKAPRMPGDGTNVALDWLATLVIYAGIFVGDFFWSRHAAQQGLAYDQKLVERIILVQIAAFIATAVHELGHAAAALALEMRIRRFVVGPLDWRVRAGKWQCKFSPSALLGAMSGAVGSTPASMEEYRWRQIGICAAGPLASLLLGMIALGLAFSAKGMPWEPCWRLFSYMSIFALLGFAVNLIPLQPESQYSDGANIYQLLAAGPASQVQHAFAMVSSTLVSPLRPKDYDVDLIRQAASVCSGRRALLLHLNTVSCFLDQGRTPEAQEALEKAEAVYAESATTFPAELRIIAHDAFTFASAMIRRDAAAARAWWDRTTEKRPDGFTADTWRAYCSLLWIEGRTTEARDAWAKGYALAEKFPKAGVYDFDRDCFGMLKNELEAVAA